MIDLYAAGTSNGMRARIALEECGLPYKLNFIDLTKGEHKTPQFLAMNPNGQIPVIVDHQGPGGKPVTLSQSTAILPLRGKSGNSCPRIPPRASRAAGADERLHRHHAAVRHHQRGARKEPHAPPRRFKDRLREFFRVWDVQLGKRKYAAGDESRSPTSRWLLPATHQGRWRTAGRISEPDTLGGRHDGARSSAGDKFS
jgi:glutathione S-transferase